MTFGCKAPFHRYMSIVLVHAELLFSQEILAQFYYSIFALLHLSEEDKRIFPLIEKNPNGYDLEFWWQLYTVAPSISQ